MFELVVIVQVMPFTQLQEPLTLAASSHMLYDIPTGCILYEVACGALSQHSCIRISRTTVKPATHAMQIILQPSTKKRQEQDSSSAASPSMQAATNSPHSHSSTRQRMFAMYWASTVTSLSWMYSVEASNCHSSYYRTRRCSRHSREF